MIVRCYVAIFEQFLSIDFKLLDASTLLMLMIMVHNFFDGFLRIREILAGSFMDDYLLLRVAIFQERLITHLAND